MTYHIVADRERGGYAEILRSLGWKSNYANDGHYDWWMKPDEFDIVSFREAVNSLRSSPIPVNNAIPSLAQVQAQAQTHPHTHALSHANTPAATAKAESRIRALCAYVCVMFRVIAVVSFFTCCGVCSFMLLTW